MSLPKTMRVIHQPSPTSHHLTLQTSPLPIRTHPSDILIKVKATCPCLGELDWLAAFPDALPQDKEPVPGQDVLGTVIEAPDDSGFKAGDDIFGRIDAAHPGGCREYATVRKEEMALVPKGLDWKEAVATPLSALTAWQALFYQGTLEKEAVFGDTQARNHNAKQRVFIAGAGTQVGSWAVQLAALAGARGVVALCSGASADRIKGFGATEIVDYKKTTAEAWVKEDISGREVDLVVDCIGGASMSHLWSVVKSDGTFMSIAGMPDAVKPEGDTKSLKKAGFFIVESNGKQLSELAKLTEAGKVKPMVDGVFEFEQFADAFDRVESRKANGKVVIRVS